VIKDRQCNGEMIKDRQCNGEMIKERQCNGEMKKKQSSVKLCPIPFNVFK
jgi:hypothetical protein